MIISYFDVVKKNVNDLVPKTVITFFIRKTTDLAEKEIIEHLYREDTIDKVMKEDEGILKQREGLLENLRVLKECLVLINDFEQAH